MNPANSVASQSAASGPSIDPDKWRSAWGLNREVDFLNHGAFGACPLEVLAFQSRLRDRMESEPVRFLHRELEPRLDSARNALADVLRADAEGLAFVPNATSGVNTVLRSLRFEPRDSILVTNHGYNACRNAVNFVANRWGMSVQVARIACPISDPQQIVDSILSEVDTSTKIAVVDHVTSPTAIVFPIHTIVQALQARGILVLVDGAHAPGMIPLDLEKTGADFYTGNCHKWLCAPKGAAFLHVAQQHRERLAPLTISHGANSTRRDRSPFHLEFDWVGTLDPTPWLCVEAAIDFLGRVPGGLDAVMKENRSKLREAKDLIMREVGLPCTVATEECSGSIASFLLPGINNHREKDSPGDNVLGMDPLQVQLYDSYRIEVPVFRWPDPELRLLRISSQLYNSAKQYERLAGMLKQCLDD